MQKLSTKEKLLFAALDLFSEKGYEATTVDEIAESIGIKGPNLYKYFKGKEALFLELSHISEITYRDRMKLEGDPAERIHNAEQLKQFSIEQVIYTMNDDTTRKLRKLMTIEQYKNKYICNIATVHQFENIKELYTRIMSKLIKEGKIEPYDPEWLALIFTSPTTLMIQAYDREPHRKDEMMRKIVDHIDCFIEKYVKQDTVSY